MSESAFPKPVAEIVTTLTELYRHQKRIELVELLESSNARLDEIHYDNFNGGTTTWALRLEAPVPVYVSIEPNLAAVESEIASKLNFCARLFPNDPIGEITIFPIAQGDAEIGQRVAPSKNDVSRLWPDGRFRLFLSHVSKHKVAVSKLKNELELHGISAFVAHVDIEPSLEWQKEIELGLRSMHAIAALITPDFHASSWTDQEIGWAMGRGVLVVSVRLGADPYGFAGKVQGVSGDLLNPKAVAEQIVNVLLAKPQTQGEMKRSIASAFCSAESYIMAQTLRKNIVKIQDFTEDEKNAMLNACVNNSNVKKAHFVPGAIRNAFGLSSPSGF